MLTREEVSSVNRRLFETSQDVILVTDGRGTLIQVSPSSAAVLGYRPEEMIGRSAANFIFPAALDPTREEMRAARPGRATRHLRARDVHRRGHAGSLVWIAVRSETDHNH